MYHSLLQQIHNCLLYIVVTSFIASTKLLYIEPGYYWDGRRYVTSQKDQLSLASLQGR